MAKANQKKDRTPPIVTPAGKFKFPKLTEPDLSEYSTQKYPEGLFKVGVVFKPGDTAWEAFVEKVQAFYDENVKELKAKKEKVYPNVNPFVKPDTEKNDEGDKVETGLSFIEAKLPAMTKGDKAKGKKPRPQKPVLVDSQRNPLPADTQVWGGTTGKLSILLNFYNEAAKNIGSGVSFRLVGAQVLNLVSGGGFTAESAGFEDEDGYVAEGAPEKDAEETAADDESSEGDGEEKPF